MKNFPLDHFQDETVFPEKWINPDDKKKFLEKMAKRGFHFQNDWDKWRKLSDLKKK